VAHRSKDTYAVNDLGREVSSVMKNWDWS